MQFSLTNFLLTLTTQALLKTNAQDCALTKNDVLPLNHVFFVDNHLMRQNQIPSGSSLKLACSGNTFTTHTCRNGALNPALPPPDCIDRLRSEVVIVQDPNCAAPYTMYSVGFRSGTQFTELYRTCYNAAKVYPKYVQHTVYNIPFSTNRPEAKFTNDRIISGADALTFEARSVHARFIALLGDSQPYVHDSKDIVINRGHLAPSADFLYTEHQRATFKLINIMPQFGSINNGNWRKIEEWVQRLNRNVISVKTGTIGVLTLPHSDDPGRMVPMYLGANQKNPIPQWTYKIVDNDVFVTYNNPVATDLPSRLPCTAVNCPAIGLEADFRKGYTYCCDIRTFTP